MGDAAVRDTLASALAALLLFLGALLTARAAPPAVGLLDIDGAIGPASADHVVRAIARQAEAERERRAKVIHAEGELQASEKLQQAALVLSRQLGAMQLRYLQTLGAIAGDKSATIVFPLPLDVLAGVAARARSPPE